MHECAPSTAGLRTAPRHLAAGEAGAAGFVCLQGDDGLRDLLCRPLEILPLAARASEWDFLLEESLVEAASVLGTVRLRIPRHLRQGLIEKPPPKLALHKETLRAISGLCLARVIGGQGEGAALVEENTRGTTCVAALVMRA